VEAIIVIGGGGHAKVVLSLLRRLGRYRVLGYSDLRDLGPVLGAPYLGADREIAALAAGAERLNVVIGVGQVGLGNRREELWLRLQSLPLQFPAIVSPDAIVDESAALGEAAVVMPGAVINCAAAIGRGAIINTNSTIEHDVIIDDWVHIAPGATLSGGVRIGRASMVGAGATVIEGIRIAPGCLVGAGATVIRDLEQPGVYAGCPARLIKPS
jgi:sugar O-acyltransferase (sialic acid O-acetyltransferase NeuD family)